MAVPIARLRRWFAAGVIFVCVVVAGAFFYAKHRVQNALKQIPGKMGIEIQQSAQGFTISKSEQGRTLFKLQASKAVQFKLGGHAELHDVTITLFGRDSSRFDQVYGQEFDYDQQAGEISSRGAVSIDLQANPRGILSPDQTPPKELKDPIHLKTTNLVFNQKTGDARTASAVEFRVSQASGSAVGASYVAKEGVLTLQSQVKIVVNGSAPSTIVAEQATLEKNPREIVLRGPRAESPERKAQSDELRLFLHDDNTLDRAVASGHVQIESTEKPSRKSPVQHAKSTPGPSTVSAQKLEIKMLPHNAVQSAVLSGEVQFKTNGSQPSEMSAGRAVLSFGAKNAISKVHAEEQVKLLEHQKSGAAAQDVAVSAPAMNFLVSDGRLTLAETEGRPQILVLPADNKSAKTNITADKFIAHFDDLGQLSSVHGEANARVVTTPSPKNGVQEPDRVSTSDSIDAAFRPGTGIESMVQEGHFEYTAGTQSAFADHARYTPADQIVVLEGSPRIVDSGMATTAHTVRLNRTSGDGFADGDVKTTYSDLKPQPSGALLASSDPVHVTAQHMTAHKSPSVATYTGNARLWQDANLVEAPSIQFDKAQRMVTADSTSSQKVSTVLVGTDKSGKVTPVSVTSSHLAYRDSERKAHFEGGVRVRSVDLTIKSDRMDVFLAVPAQAGHIAPGPSKVEKIIASGSVLITEPNRRGTGEQLVYTAADEKFVLTGGPPSIFDAEHGKITGVSLTLFRHDDRVVVEGDSSSPAVTQTRVVR